MCAEWRILIVIPAQAGIGSLKSLAFVYIQFT